MKYLANIVSYDENLEHILTINVEHTILEVFSTSIPYLVEYKKEYLIDLEAMVFDEYTVTRVNEFPQIRKIGNSLKYEIIGNLSEGKIKVNDLVFEDTILNSDFGYLDNEIVKWVVDRIDVYFYAS